MNKKTRKKISGILFLIAICVALIGATQIFAAKVNYNPILGKPIVGKFYNPIQYFTWVKYCKNAPIAIKKSQNFIFMVMVITVFILGILNKEKKKEDSHGSSDWANKNEINETGLIVKKEEIEKEYKRSEMLEVYKKTMNNNPKEIYEDGVVCGRDKDGRVLYSLGMEHMIAMAPTRSGKGVGLVIPTLLTWKGSVFVLDIKNENYQLTSKYREKILGQKIIRFAPAEIISDKYNPLAEIELGTLYEYDQAKEIAETIITVNEKDTFFGPTARTFLTGAILFVMYNKASQGKTACLRDVYRFITSPSMTEEEKFGAMATENHISEKFEKEFIKKLKEKGEKIEEGEHLFYHLTKDIIVIEDEERPYIHPIVARIGADMLGRAEEERSGVISSAKTNLALFDSPTTGEATSSSDFKIHDLMNDKKPISFYFVIAPKDIEKMGVVARILITQIIGKLTKEIKLTGKPYIHRLLMLLDEFPAIGKMALFETSLAFIAGYGLKAFMITQSLNQLYSIYGRNNKILDNCHIQIFYAPNDTDTPQMLEKKLGNKTITNKNVSYKGIKYFSNWSYTESKGQRPLMYAAEISQLPKTDSLVFVTGHKPILAKKIRWYEEEKYQNRQKLNL